MWCWWQESSSRDYAPLVWRIQDLVLRSGPDLRQCYVFVWSVEPLKVVGGASYLNGIVVQSKMFGGRLPANRVAADKEVVCTLRSVPVVWFGAYPWNIVGNEGGDGRLRLNKRMIAHDVDGEGHEEEVGLLRASGDEGTLQKRDLKRVLAVIVPDLRIEGLRMGKKNGCIRGWIVVHQSIRIHKYLEFL